MSRKQIFILIGCMIGGIVLFAAIFALSPIAEPIARQPFSRNFDSGFVLSKQAQIDLGVNSFYIAGATENTIYLGSQTGPLRLIEVKLPQLDTQHIIVNIKGINLPEDYRRFRVKVDSPYFYLSHGTLPGIFKGSLRSRHAISFLSVNPPYFVDLVPVSNTLCALKSFSIESNGNELAVLRPDSPYFEFKPDLLEKQVDGIYCVEGTMHYDSKTNRLVYVYAYRNEYLVMDTSLNLINRYHTIDTFKRASINVAEVTSKNYRTLASPPVSINTQSCVSGNLLFIRSHLLAKNEDPKKYRAGSVFDTYDMSEGKYLYSFYIDYVDQRAPSSLTLVGPYIAAIFDQHLILFKRNLISDRQNVGAQHSSKLRHKNFTSTSGILPNT